MEAVDLLANPGVYLFLVLAATMLLSYVANYCLARIFAGKTYRYLIAPGVVVHEYSHAVACLLTGARIREIRLFDARGGRVVHEAGRVPLAEGIISTAPIFGACLAVYLLARLLVPSFIGYGEIEFSSWQFLLFVYLAGTVSAAMAPSWQDLRVGLAAFTTICAVITAGAFVPPVADYVSALTGGLYDTLTAVLRFGLAVLAVLAFTSGIAYLVMQKTVRKGARYEPLQ